MIKKNGKSKTLTSIRVFLTLTLIFILNGCTTFIPVPKGYDGRLVMVMDSSERVSSTKVYFFQLSKVDGRPVKTSKHETVDYNVNMGLNMTPMTAQRMIPAGKTMLSIEGITHVAAPILALGGKMYNVKGEVEVELKHDTTYVINGELSKDYCAVWVETLARDRVSDKIEKFNK